MNNDAQLAVPNYFINFTTNIPKVIFPQFRSFQKQVDRNYLEELGIELSLGGLLKNLIINFDTSKEILKANIQDLQVSPYFHGFNRVWLGNYLL